jgi:proline iminopeptidase
MTSPAVSPHPKRKRIWRIIKWILFGLLVVLALGIAALTVTRYSAYTTADAIRKITSHDGIEVRQQVVLGGNRQWITIRGHHKNNPVLLFIHGGPGAVDMPLSHGFQTPWEEYFTVVQWDQRGSGKSYSGIDKEAVKKTLTVDRMVTDAEELTAYLRKRMGQEKIIVVGHSWGSMVGVMLAKRRPDWLHAYVGMGQLVNPMENERLRYSYALKEAARRGDTSTLAALKAIAPYPTVGHANFDKVLTLAGAINDYDDASHKIDGSKELTLLLSSPDYSAMDIYRLATGVSALFPARTLFDEIMATDLNSLGPKFDVPVMMFSGRHDWVTPTQISTAYFDSIEAPQKKLIWFEHSGHNMFNDEPGAVFVALVNEVRPLALINPGQPASPQKQNPGDRR